MSFSEIDIINRIAEHERTIRGVKYSYPGAENPTGYPNVPSVLHISPNFRCQYGAHHNKWRNSASIKSFLLIAPREFDGGKVKHLEQAAIPFGELWRRKFQDETTLTAIFRDLPRLIEFGLSDAIYRSDIEYNGVEWMGWEFTFNVEYREIGNMTIAPYYNVTDYGAIGDGVTDDTVAIQATINAALVTNSNNALVRAGTVIFPPRRYLVSSSITIPLFNGGTYGTPFLISGYGADIRTTGAISTFKRTVPTTTAEAGNAATLAPIFEGLCLIGPNISGSKAIDMVATYGMVVRDCRISTYDTGISAAYCLKARFENTFIRRCLTYGFEVKSANGLWGDATVSNSSSNSSEFVSCRVDTSTGQAAGWYLRDSDNFRLIECIAEGQNPVNNIDYSDTGRHTLIIENMHFENTPTGAHVRAIVRGRTVLRNPVFYSTSTVLVDGSSSNNAATIVIDGLTYVDTGNQFKHGTTETYAWDFRGIGDNENFDVTDSARWVSGTVPTRLRTLFQGVAIGINDNIIRKRARGATSTADGGTIAHGLSATPTIARTQVSVSGEFASVTGLDATNITIAIKKHDGTAGTTQTIYWDAET